MLETKHHYLPVFMAIFIPVTFIITYSIAVANDHVKPVFPYISDTGTHPPESCVFGQLLNIAAVICGMIVYVRYRHVTLLYGMEPSRRVLLNLNTAAFIIGLIASFGMSVVGNFQETSVLAVHLIGAFMAFGVGFIYCLLQTLMSYKMADTMPGNTHRMRVYRVVLCVLEAIFLLILVVTTPIAIKKGSAGNVSTFDWTSSDPGYTEHLISTISEWIIAIISVLYFSTYYREFKHFRVTPPQLVPYDGIRSITETQPPAPIYTSTTANNEHM